MNMDTITIRVDSLSRVSDGNHTIEELYDHRVMLFIALCRRCQDFLHHGDARNKFGDEKIVWRSKLHADGSSFEGWFIMGIWRQPGNQISYHLPISCWEETHFAETLDNAPKWDGHTGRDVLERLKKL